jgi:hypothetical protein
MLTGRPILGTGSASRVGPWTGPHYRCMESLSKLRNSTYSSQRFYLHVGNGLLKRYGGTPYHMSNDYSYYCCGEEYTAISTPTPPKIKLYSQNITHPIHLLAQSLSHPIPLHHSGRHPSPQSLISTRYRNPGNHRHASPAAQVWLAPTDIVGMNWARADR